MLLEKKNKQKMQLVLKKSWETEECHKKLKAYTLLKRSLKVQNTRNNSRPGPGVFVSGCSKYLMS